MAVELLMKGLEMGFGDKAIQAEQPCLLAEGLLGFIHITKIIASLYFFY